MDNTMKVLQKLKLELPYDLQSIPGHISGQNYNEKWYVHPCVHSTIATPRKQPECPLTGEWTGRRQTHTKQHYWATNERNKAIRTAWVQLETVIPVREVRKTQTKPYDITYMWNLDDDTNELMQELETNSQIERKDLWLSRRGVRDGPGVWHQQMRSTTHRMDRQGPTAHDRELHPVSCDKQQWKRI